MDQNETQFSGSYADLSDDGLMELSIEGGLIPEAQHALAAEMQKRSISSSDVNEFKKWRDENAKPAPVRRTIFGYGLKFVGKKFLSTEDEREGIFVATRFVVLMGMPMIPLGSFRVDQHDRGFPQIHSSVALQLDQVWSGLWPTISLFIVGAAAGVLTAYLADKNRHGF
jgi:hypothetical protein